jgi:hypothetical protein
MVVHSCNPSSREAEAERSGVLGQPGLRNETLSQKQNNNNNNKIKKHFPLLFFIFTKDSLRILVSWAWHSSECLYSQLFRR